MFGMARRLSLLQSNCLNYVFEKYYFFPFVVVSKTQHLTLMFLNKVKISYVLFSCSVNEGRDKIELSCCHEDTGLEQLTMNLRMNQEDKSVRKRQTSTSDDANLNRKRTSSESSLTGKEHGSGIKKKKLQPSSDGNEDEGQKVSQRKKVKKNKEKKKSGDGRGRAKKGTESDSGMEDALSDTEIKVKFVGLNQSL